MSSENFKKAVKKEVTNLVATAFAEGRKETYEECAMIADDFGDFKGHAIAQAIRAKAEGLK